MATSMKLIALALVLFAVWETSQAKCDFCHVIKCKSFSYKLCPNGFLKDSCGCCFVCRRQRGESCGGTRDQLGMCGPGLKCKPSRSDEATDAEAKLIAGDWYTMPGKCA